jgi:transcriptional regulator with XRE-family HTH domain
MPNKDPYTLFYTELGKHIKEKRISAKISQEELAKKANLSRVSIVNIEKGIQKIQVHALLLVADILEIKLDDFKHLILREYSESSTLDRNYQKTIENSGINNLNAFKKNLLDLRKHL